MNKQMIKFGLTAMIGLLAAAPCGLAAELTAAEQAKVDAKLKAVQTWASDPILVKAVKEHNASLSADLAAMTQEKWKSLSILDPLVRGFSKNDAGQFLKSKKDDTISEAFLSGADGTKVAFLLKPSSWSHKDKAKHEQPMAGKTWQGPVELDESTGLQQVQIAVPVMDNGKPVGSLVVGLSIAKLE